MEGSVVKDHAAALCSKISEYRQNDVYNDVEFRVEGKSFKCHRLVLGAVSEYFHVMFTSKFKESTESVITLEEVAADTFEAVLQFIYTGDVSMTPATNLCELFCASDFYKLPGLEEALLPHIREYAPLLAKNVLELYSFFRSTGKKKTIEILDESILNNFGDFSQTSEFLKISITDLNRILKQLGNFSIPNHDIFHKAIIRWTNYAVSHSSKEKKRYSERLLTNIDCRKLSGQYLIYMTKWHIEHSNVRTEDEVDEITQSKADGEISRRIHAFANNHNYSVELGGLFEVESELFSCYHEFNRDLTWIHSYSFEHRLPDFMRTVEVNNSLYCLSYDANYTTGRQETKEKLKENKFIATPSVSLSPKSSLTPPPLVLQNFEMCRMRENIYVYNKHALSEVVRNIENPTSLFDEEALSRAIYLYNTEIDVWQPVPPLRQKFANACLTCDEKMLYLIGGTNANKYVQGYDRRTSEWIALAPTSSTFERAACCVSFKNVYVSGGYYNPKKVELYDPTAAKWNDEPDMREGLFDHEMLVDEFGFCITYNKYVRRSRPRSVFAINRDWTSSIYGDLVKSIALIETEVIHMTRFKPYGF